MCLNLLARACFADTSYASQERENLAKNDAFGTLIRSRCRCSNYSVYSSLETQLQIVQSVDSGRMRLFRAAYTNFMEKAVTPKNQISSARSTGSLDRSVATGFGAIDRLTGGLQPGVSVITGSVGSGKSRLALSIAANASVRGHVPTLYASLETSRWQVMFRLLSAEAGLDLDVIRSGRLQGDQLVEATRCLERMHSAPMYIDDAAGMNIAELRSRVRTIQRERPVRLIVIDYAEQLVAAGFDAQEDAMWNGLRQLAGEFDCAVLAVSSHNRVVGQHVDTLLSITSASFDPRLRLHHMKIAIVRNGQRLGSPVVLHASSAQPRLVDPTENARAGEGAALRADFG